MRASQVRVGFNYHARIRGTVMVVRVTGKHLGGKGRWYWTVKTVDEEDEELQIRSQHSFKDPCCPQCRIGKGEEIDEAGDDVWYRCGRCDHAFPLAKR